MPFESKILEGICFYILGKKISPFQQVTHRNIALISGKVKYLEVKKFKKLKIKNFLKKYCF